MHKREPMRPRVRLSPYIRLILGLLLVIAAVAAVQLGVAAMALPRIWEKILLVVVTWPAAFGAYAIFVRWAERREVSELAIANAAGEVGLGVVIGCLMFGGVVAVLAILGSFAIIGTNPWGVVVVPFLIAVTSAVFEEVLFRGVMFRLLEEGMGSWIALAISAMLFGGLHLINQNATVMGAAAVGLAGIAISASFMLTRRLWLPIGMHFAWNFAQSGIFGIAVSGNAPLPGLFKTAMTGADWLTGGAFGAEASIVSVVMVLIVGGLFLAAAIRRGNVVSAHRSRRDQVQ